MICCWCCEAVFSRSFHGDPTFVSTALATRTSRMCIMIETRLVAQGRYFVVILTDTGWCNATSPTGGPQWRRSSREEIAAGCRGTCHDTVTFSGEVTMVNYGLITVKVVGRNTLWRPRDREGTFDIYGSVVLSGQAAIVGNGAPPTFEELRSKWELRLAAVGCVGRCGPSLTDVDGLTTFTMDN